MKRNFRTLLALTALAATLAMTGSAFAGKGFSLGGGGGGGGMSGGMRSSNMQRSMPSGGGMQFKTQANNFPKMNVSGGRGLSSQGLKPVQHMGHGNNFTKHLQGQVMNKTLPNVNPSLLQGNVRNNLLGNASGAHPKLGINKVGGGQLGNVLGGQPGGHVQGGISKHIGGHVGGGVQGKFVHHKGKADCGHVIDMLIRHSVGNRCYDPCIKHRCPDPMWMQVGWIPAPAIIVGPGGAVAGDLELVEVGMLTDATPEQGPVYQVTIRNVGTIDAEQFRVSIVAVLGEIAEDSPSVTINVDRIAAGETATLQIQMPVTVMALGPQGQEAVAFDTMVVAIDSFDELVESNELNNVSTLKRTEVQLIQVGVAATVEAAPAAVEQAPAAAAEAPGVVEAAPAPQEGAAPNATEEIDIDNIELSGADTAAELFTR